MSNPIAIFVADQHSCNPDQNECNFHDQMLVALSNENTGSLQHIVSIYQQHNEKQLLKDLVTFLRDEDIFSRLAPWVEWNETAILAVVRQLRPLHAHTPHIASWCEDTLMNQTSPALQQWQLHWAALNGQLDVMETLLQNNTASDNLFSHVLASDNKQLLDVIAPYARSTLQDPLPILALAYEVAHYCDDVSWIDPLLAQYTTEEIHESIQKSDNSQNLDAFRSYIVQYNLKDLSNNNSSKNRRL